MIVTKLNGGLGNQLFEYAYARDLQLKNDDSLYLDIEGFKRSPRHFSLENFVLAENVKILPENKSRSLIVLQAISKYNRKAAYYIGKIANVYLWKSSEYREIHVGETKGRIAYFYGYWQSEKYFYDNREQIKNELKVKTAPLEISKKYLNIASKPNTTCVHIRRGDYVSCNMIACDEKYYLDGMDYIHKKVGDCPFLIFTDDIEWTKENIHFKYPVIYVDIENPDYEVLRIMYTCQHYVMSNSSFSWWGQYLSDNKKKIVIAPKVWYPMLLDTEVGVYQDDWIIL